ncbi:MAG: hypothetical protein Q8P84_02995 [Deltaproteobacteria bacterium]|nr:hypothetical protein [Deltaproteobacteria bacterium]
MISGGEKIRIPNISKPVQLPIDLDFPKKDYPPNVSVFPVAQDTCNDFADLRTVTLKEGVRALRVQFFSEVDSLFGKTTEGTPGRDGWSDYAIYLEASGKIYARQVISRTSGADDPVSYNLENPKWPGFPERITTILAEVVAGWELRQAIVANRPENSSLHLARWLDGNRNLAKNGIPATLLAGIDSSASAIPVDLDDNNALRQPPSLGTVILARQTTNDSVLIEKTALDGKEAVRVRFRSEVDHPELGSKTKNEKSGLDDLAPRSIYLTQEGIKVFEEQNGTKKQVGSLSMTNERLAAVLAGAFAAAGAQHLEFPFAKSVLAAKMEVRTFGYDLPIWERLKPTSTIGQILQYMSEGGFGDPY